MEVRFTFGSGAPIRAGDYVTIAGVFELIPNPDRRWWQFWKPRMIETYIMQRFRVVDE